ncbi:MAG: hypothetical protein QXK37_02575 [Candidatus Woesearchaeota archaeon]
MATPTLNLEFIKYFTPIFTFILVWAVLYALLQYAKMLGDNKNLHAAIAAVIAIFAAIISSVARQMIEYMVPWFTVLIIFTVLVIVIYKIFGASDDDVRTVIRKHSGVQWTIAILAILIGLGALSNVFGQKALSYSQPVATEQPVGDIEIPKETGTTDTTQSRGSTGTTTTGTPSFQTNLNKTFYHPKVIGTIFLLLVATFTIAQLSRPVTKGWP